MNDLIAFYDALDYMEKNAPLKAEASGKYDHIDFKPPQGVADEAKKGLEYRKRNGGKGGLSNEQASEAGVGSGVQRAVDLQNRKEMSTKSVKRMKAFFSRHEKNKDLDAGEKAWESKGRIAWLLWGGDAGRSWAEKICNQMDAANEKD
jgi:hypothetical protein